MMLPPCAHARNAARSSAAGRERGSALMLAVVVSGVISALASTLLLTTTVERLLGANTREFHDLRLAADAALDLARADLLAYDAWTSALEGTAALSWSDGPLSGERTLIDGSRIVIEDLTAMATCGRPSCRESDIVSRTAERPWGARNPRWRPIGVARASDAAPPEWPGHPAVVVWIADDPADADADPWVDAPDGGAGHGQFLLRAQALGRHGARATVEALVRHDCAGLEGAPCVARSRVQSWRPVP